nr:methionine gamma-lyase family protein [Tuberibacillus sp. Marseille-P3662]
MKQTTHLTNIQSMAEEAEAKIQPQMKQIDQIAEANQFRVIKSFQEHQVSDTHLTGTTGYGYDDLGRDTLEAIYADVFGAEDALVRPQIVSGTHAISTAFFGVLRPGDELVYISGKPYDTLDEVIGWRGNASGTLQDYGIHCRWLPLTSDNEMDSNEVLNAITGQTKMIAIQRSRGYESRPSFSVGDIDKMIKLIKKAHPEIIVFVDNCYGEFVEELEPPHIGADLIAGSLIKNPGGGLAKTGGYIAGRTSLIEQCAGRMTAPGIGREVGPAFSGLDLMYQGLFLAPHVTAQALKGAVFTAALLEEAGYQASPTWYESRTDLVQTVSFNTKQELVQFCQMVQKHSPINAHVKPYPDDMPGYDDPVIMAAGTFVQGSSIELTADAPLRSPYVAYVQGGLTYEHVKIAVSQGLETIIST